jgi:hypothetical protein
VQEDPTSPDTQSHAQQHDTETDEILHESKTLGSIIATPGASSSLSSLKYDSVYHNEDEEGAFTVRQKPRNWAGPVSGSRGARTPLSAYSSSGQNLMDSPAASSLMSSQHTPSSIKSALKRPESGGSAKEKAKVTIMEDVENSPVF